MSRSPTIVSLEARDIRFPTSRWLDGSDAMHTDPDYSAAYVVLRTEADDGLEGHGLTFTSGRGTEVCVAAARALEPLVVGRSLEGIVADMSGFWRSLASDTQLRWLGPEKGVIHLATGAVVNAVWDLWAKREGKPLWKLLCGPLAGGTGRLRRLPVHRRRPATRGGARALAGRTAWGRGSRARDRRLRLPGVHDLGGLARLLTMTRSRRSFARRSPPVSPTSR